MSPASSTSRCRPPYAAVPTTERDVFANWIAAGMPAGSCSPPTDAGIPPLGDAGVDAGPSDAGVSSDLPCGMAQTLATYCTACHGSPTTNGAPFSLNSLAALQAMSPTYPGQTPPSGRWCGCRAPPSPCRPPLCAGALGERERVLGLGRRWHARRDLHRPSDGGVPPVLDAGRGRGPADAGVSGDLPCSVAHTLGTYCTACHGSPPTNGAPFSLNSLAALQAISPTYPGQTQGQRSLVRMQSTTQPMPPRRMRRCPPRT